MTEETFVEELERHAEQIHGAPLTVASIRGRAVRIRRRRRVAAGGLVALVAVAAVLPGVLPGSGPRTPDPAPAPVRVPASAVLLHDGTVRLPEGRSVDLGVDGADVTELAVLDDGRVVLARQRPYAVEVYSPAGSLLASHEVAENALTASPDDRQVAWVGKDLRVRVLTAGEPEPAILPGVPMPGEAVGRIDAVLGPDRYLAGDGSTTTVEVTPEGPAALRTSESLRVADVSPDGALWAVQYRDDDADPQFGCTGVYDPEAARMLARSCETALLSFSPDGRHLVGAKGDNGTWGSVEVFDLDLRPVGDHRPERGVISAWGWADTDHLLVAEAVGTRWQLLRVPVDGGAPTLLDGPVTGPSPELDAAYRISR